MGLFLEVLTDVISDTKREIDLTRWIEDTIQDFDSKLKDYSILIIKVHPLGKKTLSDSYQNSDWTEEDVQEIVDHGKLLFNATGDKCVLTLYDYEEYEYPVAIVESDIRTFYVRPEDLTKEEIEEVLTYLKENKRIGFSGILVTKLFLFLIKK